MTNFVIFTLAVLLLSTDVECGKNKEVKELEKRVDTLEQMLKDSKSTSVSSSTFTRWGHTECGGDAEVVYTGYMAGSRLGQLGGGSNYLCLTPEPKFATVDKATNPISLLFGARFKFDDDKEFSEALCVVCMIPRSSVIMIPGTNQCKDGWNLEYWGYLVSQSYIQKRTEFICMDENPKAQQNRTNKDFSAALVKVETRYGKLPEQYPVGYELTCAVCSFGSR
ncbi:hypothetical protein ACF0H5_001071 [Mactra antiquata]